MKRHRAPNDPGQKRTYFSLRGAIVLISRLNVSGGWLHKGRHFDGSIKCSFVQVLRHILTINPKLGCIELERFYNFTWDV